MRRLWVMLFALAFASGSVTRSEAAVIWDYEIINNNQVVQPDDSFGIQVRFYNNSSAGESFGLINSGADFEVNSWAYGAPDVYEFTDEVTANLGSQTVAAGSYLDFEFGLLEPVMGNPVPEGDYVSQIALVMRKLKFYTPEQGYTLIDPQTANPRTFQWTVTTVPEPATVVLLGMGLIGLAGLSRRLGRDRPVR